jgi:hypothetical protein
MKGWTNRRQRLGGATGGQPKSNCSSEIQVAPRPDESHWDASGPMKFGITASIGGKTQQFILPARLEERLIGSNAYRGIVGSKVFYGGTS